MMTQHVARSRITKALTDANLAASFSAAEARLDAVYPCVLISAAEAATPAGQMAALTAIATAYKCFGRVLLAGAGFDTPLTQPLPIGQTLGAAAQVLGAMIAVDVAEEITHLIRMGDARPWRGWQVATWWDRWLSGTRLTVERNGSSQLPLSGMFAAALAVRQIFAHVLRTTPAREATISLWEPDRPASLDRNGPRYCTIPNRLWLIGLGHLGQAMVWGLLSLPFRDQRYVVLQDDQWIAIENEPTSLLVRPNNIGQRKVRIASQWLEHGGWTTELIERRHHGDIELTQFDPRILLSGLDQVDPRRILAAHGFDYMIDAGIGHGATDFEALQIRVIPDGSKVEELWLEEPETNRRDQLMAKEAYAALGEEIGQCGIVPLADASVAVPFVGAATAALALAQLVRLGTMAGTTALLQVELSAPDMVIEGEVIRAPSNFLGGESFTFE